MAMAARPGYARSVSLTRRILEGARSGLSSLTSLVIVDDEPLSSVEAAALEVELQSLIMDEMLWVPIVAPTNVLVMSKELTGAPATFSYMFGPWAAYIGAA